MNMFTCDNGYYKVVSNSLLEIHRKYFHKDQKFICDVYGHKEWRIQSRANHKPILHEGAKYNMSLVTSSQLQRQTLEVSTWTSQIILQTLQLWRN